MMLGSASDEPLGLEKGTTKASWTTQTFGTAPGRRHLCWFFYPRNLPH